MDREKKRRILTILAVLALTVLIALCGLVPQWLLAEQDSRQLAGFHSVEEEPATLERQVVDSVLIINNRSLAETSEQVVIETSAVLSGSELEQQQEIVENHALMGLLPEEIYTVVASELDSANRVARSIQEVQYGPYTYRTVWLAVDDRPDEMYAYTVETSTDSLLSIGVHTNTTALTHFEREPTVAAWLDYLGLSVSNDWEYNNAEADMTVTSKQLGIKCIFNDNRYDTVIQFSINWLLV